MELAPGGIGGSNDENGSDKDSIGSTISSFNLDQRFNNNGEETTASEEEDGANNAAPMEQDDTTDTNRFSSDARETEAKMRAPMTQLSNMQARLKEHEE